MTARACDIALRVAAVLATLLGAALCWMYFDGAIIDRLGEPDQSYAFWYLPILFLGLGSLGLGVVLWLVARHRVCNGDREG